MTILLVMLAILGVGAAASIVLAGSPRVGVRVAMGAVVAASALGVGLAISVLTQDDPAGSLYMASWPMPLGAFKLGLDGLSAWFILTICLLSAATAIYSPAYMDREIDERQPVAAFGALMCLMMASMLLLVCAADTVLFLVGWELMSISSFFLVAFHDREEHVRRGAWMYLIATHLGTALCLMPMFGLLVAQSNSTTFAAYAFAMKNTTGTLPAVLFVLALIGFGTKAGFMPMHVWLPNAHPAAPSPVSALLSGVVIKTGIYGVLRVVSWLPVLPAWCGITMLIVGMISGVLGIAYAVAQHDLKRLLAYCTVENIGIIGIGIGMGMLGEATRQPVLATLGYGGALLHVLNHALSKGLLFLSAGSVLHSTGTAWMDRLGGLAKVMPGNAALFLVAAVSICALPPFNGFVSEWLIYRALFGGAVAQQGWSWAPVLGLAALALIGGLALAGFAKAFTIIFLGEMRDRHLHVHPVSRPMLWGMLPLAVLCLAIGMLAGLVVPLLRGAVLPLRADSDVLTSAMEPLGSMGLVLAVLLVVIVILLTLRQRLAKRQPSVGGVATWGCGHPYADPRVQYTASSFSWTLVHCFRHSLRPTVRLTPPEGYFPQGGELATQTLDAVETRAFTPLFGWIARQAQRLWPLQHGRLQLYVIYIVLALLLVFVIEAVWAPYAGPPDGHATRPPLSSVVIHQGG